MSVNDAEKEIVSAERRNFLRLTAAGTFTTAMVAGAAGTLWSDGSVAQSEQEEQERQAAAEHVMTIATAYVLGASRSYPLMQLDLKENIQNTTNGKVYVKLAPAGAVGAGGTLALKVQSGARVQAAQHSLSNFAPFAPAVDLVNLPYLCGTNQRFVNLVTSVAWQEQIHPIIEAKGFKPLFYVVIDPRVVAIRKGGKGAVLTPKDLSGVKFRVPGSKMLQQYYRMIGARPIPFAWSETPSAIEQGIVDAVDSSVGALYVFGFKDLLSHITLTQAVPDSQVYSCNLEWFNSLPTDVQEAIEFAAEITAQQNLAQVPAARNFAMSELKQSGVEFHGLSPEQLSQWRDAGGYQRKEWQPFKVELAGSMNNFAKLEEAAETRGRYYVQDA